MPNMSPKKILLLDYYSEKNRGDAAIQVGLVRLVRAQFPEATVSVVSSLGANQSRDLPEHFPHTREEGVAVYGGLCPTTVSLQESNRFLQVKAIRAFVAGGSFLLCVALLGLLAVRVPVSLLAVCMPASFRKTIQILAESDMVVWRGTNFRSGTSFLRDAYSTFFWCFQPLACLFMGKPVTCVGVSLWLPRTFVARAIYRMAFRQCIFFAVREEESLGRVRSILGGRGPEVVLMPDLSFILLKELTGLSSSSTRGDQVGVTIVDRHKGDSAGRARYTRVMRAILNEIVSNPATSIVIIPQVTTRSEDASGIIEEILSDLAPRARDRITIGVGEHSIEELVAEYARLDYLVATRLHSSIFALASGTPVFVMRYDEGPQWSILSMLGVGSFVVDYRATDERDIVERFRSFRIEGAYPTIKILENFKMYHEQIGVVFSQISSAYEQWTRNKQ